MREQIRDRGRLEHMLEQLQNVEEFVAGKTLSDLQDDKILQYALVKCIEIIGEAAYMLSLDFKESHPEVQWEEIVRMRHVLVHGYYQISLPLVWSVIQDDLAELKMYVMQFLGKWFLHPKTKCFTGMITNAGGVVASPALIVRVF